jgi:hypothetical protein
MNRGEGYIRTIMAFVSGFNDKFNNFKKWQKCKWSKHESFFHSICRLLDLWSEISPVIKGGGVSFVRLRLYLTKAHVAK